MIPSRRASPLSRPLILAELSHTMAETASWLALRAAETNVTFFSQDRGERRSSTRVATHRGNDVSPQIPPLVRHTRADLPAWLHHTEQLGASAHQVVAVIYATLVLLRRGRTHERGITAR